MKTIKNLKEITTLEVGDVVIFDDLEYRVNQIFGRRTYYLEAETGEKNDEIFKILNLEKESFIKNLGIKADCSRVFPETKSLEALTAIVSALFKEYEKRNELPKTWKEFCERNLIKEGECYIGLMSNICSHAPGNVRMPNVDGNICTSKQDAEAFLALMQLRQLRKAYVKDWKPDWTKDAETKYCIDFYEDRIRLGRWGITSHVLSFPTFELAELFLTNFEDLIEIAKPLL